MTKQALYYDNTMMGCYQTCQKKYWLRHIRGLVPKRTAMPLQYGDYMHQALSRWYEGHEPEYCIAVFDDYQDDPMDEKRTAARGKETMLEYIKRYPQEPFEIVANEVPFEQEIYSDRRFTYTLVGKIDLVVKWHGNIYGLDHKTTSQLGSSYFYQYELSRQMIGYLLGLKRQYEDTGYSIHGMIINAIAVYKNNFKFAREIATYTQRKLNWYTDYVPKLMQEIAAKEELYERTKDAKIFLPNWDACDFYGHCAYKDVCKSSRPNAVLEEDYQIDFWDPREEVKKHGDI